MKRKLFVLLTIIGLFSVLLGSGMAFAQGPQPPTPEPPFSGDKSGGPWGPQQGPDGTWYMPEGARPSMEAAGVTPLASGGPDDFGYTWDDTVTLSWIDATGGTDTGLTGNGEGNAAGSISLPFPFKYYENTYSQVYIAAPGYLAFTQASYWPSFGQIPSSSEPNNVIAPIGR